MINVETRLRRMNYSNGICKVCSDIQRNHLQNSGDDNQEINQRIDQRDDNHMAEENLSHLLITCQYKKSLWVLIERVILRSFGDQYPISKFHIMCGVFSEDLQNDNLFIINMILGMTRYHIYI